MEVLRGYKFKYSGPPLLCDPSVEQFRLLWDRPSLALCLTFHYKYPPDKRPPLSCGHFSLEEVVVIYDGDHCTVSLTLEPLPAAIYLYK